jgi:hypothetical protein
MYQLFKRAETFAVSPVPVFADQERLGLEMRREGLQEFRQRLHDNGPVTFTLAL